MARLPLHDPGSAPPPAGALLERIAGERGQAFNVYRALAGSPGVLEHMYGFASFLWNESALDQRLIELVILRVAQLTGSDYEWCRHRGIAARVGVPDAQVEALARWREAPAELFGAAERAALALTEEATLQVEAGEQRVAAVCELLGERATLELVVLAGFYGMVSRILRTLAVDPEPGDAPIPR